jgi:hypothetical protein
MRAYAAVIGVVLGLVVVWAALVPLVAFLKHDRFRLMDNRH